MAQRFSKSRCTCSSAHQVSECKKLTWMHFILIFFNLSPSPLYMYAGVQFHLKHCENSQYHWRRYGCKCYTGVILTESFAIYVMRLLMLILLFMYCNTHHSCGQYLLSKLFFMKVLYSLCFFDLSRKVDAILSWNLRQFEIVFVEGCFCFVNFGPLLVFSYSAVHFHAGLSQIVICDLQPSGFIWNS